jgi:hypothetical protein
MVYSHCKKGRPKVSPLCLPERAASWSNRFLLSPSQRNRLNRKFQTRPGDVTELRSLDSARPTWLCSRLLPPTAATLQHRLPKNFVARETESGDWHQKGCEALREAYPVATLAQLSASAHRPPGILGLGFLGLFRLPGRAATTQVLLHPILWGRSPPPMACGLAAK